MKEKRRVLRKESREEMAMVGDGRSYEKVLRLFSRDN